MDVVQLTGGGLVNPADLDPPLTLTLFEEVDEPQPGVFIPKLVVNFDPNMSPKYGGTVLKVQIGSGPEKVQGTYYDGPVRIPIPDPGKTVTVRAFTVHESGAEGTTPITATYTMDDPSNPMPIGPIFTTSGEAYWDKPPIRSTTTYGASAWTASGTSIFTAAAINNGDTATAALQFNTTANGLLRLDSGSAQAMREVEVYWLDTDNRPYLTFEWSDDGTNFTQISTGFPTDLTGKTVYPIPTSVTAHRYWRIAKYGTTAYAGRISEIRFLTFTGATYPYVKGYRLTGYHATGGKYSKDITFQPTATANRVPLAEFQYSYSSWDPVYNAGSGGSTTELTVQTISPTNALSEGRVYKAFSASSTTGPPGEQNWLPLGQTPYTPAAGVNPDVGVFSEQRNNVVRLTGTNTDWSLGGFTNGYAGRIITIINATTSEGSLVHEDATSTAANRLALPDNAPAALPVGGTITLVYDDVSLRWRRLDRHFTDASRVLMVSSAVQGVYSTTAGTWQWYFNNGTLGAGFVPWAQVSGKPNVQPVDGTYGSIKATGQTNGWPGIWFSDSGTGGYLLWGATQQGAYDTSIGWRWRFNNGTLDVGTVPGSAVSSPRTSWVNNAPVTAQELGWKNFGNGHTVVDNSGATYRPSNVNPDVEWAATHPTLMGFNGTNTYGVRVDRARYAEALKAGATVASSPANGDNSTAVATTAWVLANGGSSMERVSALNPSGNVAYGNQETPSKPRGFVTNRATVQSVTNVLIVSVTGKGTLRFLSGGMNGNIGWLTLVIDGTNVITDAPLTASNGSVEPGLHTSYVGSIISSYDTVNDRHHISAVPSEYGITFKTSMAIYLRTNSVSLTAYCNYAYALY